jgi:hypothetical protein
MAEYDAFEYADWRNHEDARRAEYSEAIYREDLARKAQRPNRGKQIVDAIVTGGYLLKVLIAGPVLAVTAPVWLSFKGGRHAARQIMEVCKESENGDFYRPTGSLFSTKYGKDENYICDCGCDLVL